MTRAPVSASRQFFNREKAMSFADKVGGKVWLGSFHPCCIDFGDTFYEVRWNTNGGAS